VEGRKFVSGKLGCKFKGRITRNLFGKYPVSRQERNVKTICQIIKVRCDDT
jgi:hypothetical protein